MTGTLIDPPVLHATAAEMRASLHAWRPFPEYAVLEEVRNNAGFKANRSADAIVMGLWPSRGLRLEGVEIKISRGDWARERADPAKAESFARYCDHWWIFAPQGVVKPDEVPENWGWIARDEKGRARVAKEAPKLSAEPLSRGFLAALLRRSQEAIDAAVTARVEKEAREQREKYHATVEAEIKRRTAEWGDLRELDTAVRAAFGVDARGWFSRDDVVRIVKFLHATRLHENWSGLQGVLDRIETARDAAAALATAVAAGMKEMGLEPAAKPEPIGAKKPKRRQA